MKFVNLTPHAVTLANGSFKIVFEKNPNDPIARIEHTIEERTIEHEVAQGVKISLPVNIVTHTEVYGLPEAQKDVVYIVSSMVATQVKRSDVIAPLTDSTCERDANGRVTSVKGFQTFSGETNILKEVAVTSEA